MIRFTSCGSQHVSMYVALIIYFKVTEGISVTFLGNKFSFKRSLSGNEWRQTREI